MLMQFDPFREFDRLAEQLAAGARTPRPFPMDAYRRGDEFVVAFDLPGMAPGAIDLTIEQNVLTIKAERRYDGHEGDEVIAAERMHGAFTRQLFLGETLDAERLVASYETGVLMLRIPGRGVSEAPQGPDQRRRRRAHDPSPDHPGQHVTESATRLDRPGWSAPPREMPWQSQWPTTTQRLRQGLPPPRSGEAG